jgi:hypothetical protein
MKNMVRFFIIIIFTLLPLGCSTSLSAPPTATPTATLTSTNIPTATHTPMATPTKTLKPTPSPVVEMGEKHLIPEGGFSFRVPFGYSAQIEERQAFISDLEGTLIISFTSVDSTSSEEEIIDEYLDALAKRSEGEFEKTPSEPVTVGGMDGKAFDLTGSIFGSPLKGKTFIVPVSSNRFLFGLGISNLSQDEAAWEDHGSKVFEAVIESIEFVEAPSIDTCPIATDSTYGYTKENAIRVGEGSDLLGGPARERAYLDNLRGPNGEPISYERTGSLNFEDTILDEYVIKGLGTPVTLYLDIYKFKELKAPVGFTCAGSFNLKP